MILQENFDNRDFAGIVLYGEPAYSMKQSELNLPQTYKFDLELISGVYREKVRFIATVVLNQYKIGDQYDLNAIARKFAHKQLKRATKRIKRQQANVVPPVIWHNHEYPDFNAEFLWFDKTASAFAPPFQVDKKYGALVTPRFREHDQNILQYFARAYATRRSLDVNIATYVEKQLLLESIVESASRIVIELRPYQIMLSGADDTSYTKFMFTEQDMHDEMRRLRVMQPLNFDLDVLDFGYIFTN